MNLDSIGGLISFSTLGFGVLLTLWLVFIAKARVKRLPAVRDREDEKELEDIQVGAGMLGLFYGSILVGAGLLLLRLSRVAIGWPLDWHYALLGILPVGISAISAWAGYSFQRPSWKFALLWVVGGLVSGLLTWVTFGWHLTVLILLAGLAYVNNYAPDDAERQNAKSLGLP